VLDANFRLEDSKAPPKGVDGRVSVDKDCALKARLCLETVLRDSVLTDSAYRLYLVCSRRL
jgi:hypothetical protein